MTIKSTILAMAMTTGLVVAAPLAGVSDNQTPASPLVTRQSSCDGLATFYYQYGVAGSCGNYNADGAIIAALPPEFMPGACGQTIKVTNTATGQVTYPVVQDTCPGCAGACHVDLSVGAFEQISPDGTTGPQTENIYWQFA